MRKASQAKGVVSLVGAGPGDPGLITVRGLARLGAADVVVYDRLVNPRLLSHAPSNAESVYVGKSPQGRAMEQEAINALLVARAREGKRVVRLKGGDPFVFGRGGEEAEALAREGIPFEIVPGVTSAVAVPAYAGIPVTHREMASSFTVITGREDPGKAWTRIPWEQLAGGVGTLVVLMGVETLAETVERLQRHGLPGETPAAVIEWGTWPRQRTVAGTVGDIVQRATTAGLGAPAVAVVGEVVRLRDKLRWFDSRPLFGTRVLVTRSRQQASALSERLEEAGAEAVEVPTIEVRGPPDYVTIDRVLGEAQDYQWIVFTSVNAVEAVFARIDNMGKDARLLAPLHVCAIGPATAASLQARGIRADYVPDEFTTEAVAKGMGGDGPLEGLRVVLPRADIAPQDLAGGLTARGAQVQQAVVYSTVKPEGARQMALEALAKGRIDIATFTSSSTVENLVALLGDQAVSLLNKAQVVCIGPVTARTAQRLGLRVDVVARRHTIPGLVEAILEAVRAKGGS